MSSQRAVRAAAPPIRTPTPRACLGTRRGRARLRGRRLRSPPAPSCKKKLGNDPPQVSTPCPVMQNKEGAPPPISSAPPPARLGTGRARLRKTSHFRSAYTGLYPQTYPALALARERHLVEQCSSAALSDHLGTSDGPPRNRKGPPQKGIPPQVTPCPIMQKGGDFWSCNGPASESTKSLGALNDLALPPPPISSALPTARLETGRARLRKRSHLRSLPAPSCKKRGLRRARLVIPTCDQSGDFEGPPRNRKGRKGKDPPQIFPCTAMQKVMVD